MLNEVLNKKKQIEKVNNDIRALEQKVREIGSNIGTSESVYHSNNFDNVGANCLSLILLFGGGIWIYTGYDIFYGSESWNFFSIVITHLPLTILVPYFWSVFSLGFKTGDAKNKIFKYSKQKKNIEKEVNNLKELIPNLNQEIIKLEKDYHNELVKHFKTNYDNNNNGEIDSLENKDDFLKYLKANQDKIIEVSEKMGDDYIHVLVKINDKLNLKRESINKSLAEVMKIKNGFSESSNIDVYESFIKDEIQYYNSLLANSLFMASSLVNNDRITFRTIYEKFDKLNIFNSHYENQTLELLNSINNNLVKIIQEINDLNFSITSAIEDLTYATQENTEKITQELQNIDSSINFNTLVAGINAYQNYKISKNTKSLRS